MSDARDPNTDPRDPARPSDDVPIAKPADRETFELVEDRCPKCGIPMPSMAVVCVKCGYDQRANVVREVTTGTVEPPPEPAPAVTAASGHEFVEPGRLSSKTLAITGGVLTVAALVSAGIWGPRGSFWLGAAWVAYTAYLVAVNTATGLAAVAITAKLKSQSLGSMELAAARVFAAFALFQAAVSTRVPLGATVLTYGVPYLVGAALYFGAMMILFRKDRHTTGLVALTHFILWLLLQLGPLLAGLISVAATPKPS